MRIYRWDLDKTYLQTDFDTLRQLFRTALETAAEKRSVPGASALIRELRAIRGSRLCIISGSPTQLRAVLSEKLHLDGVEFDEFILKDNLRNLFRGRFKALRGQLGYKLPALLASRANAPSDAEEILFGDDAEADAFIYSLYADMIARRVDEGIVREVLLAAEVYPDEMERVFASWEAIPRADPVRRIFIILNRLTPPAYFAKYGPRVVPIFNYFQASLVLLGDKLLPAQSVLKVVVDLLQGSGYNPLSLANSLQDLLRRGFAVRGAVESLAEALRGPSAIFQAVRPLPDIIAALTKRVAALGAAPAPLRVNGIDYLTLLADARPKGRRRWGIFA